MTEVSLGQVWSVLTRNHVRIEAKVTGLLEARVTLRGAGRIRLTMPKRTLERGLRGARLLGKGRIFVQPRLDVDGLRRRLTSVRCTNPTENRSASELRKETAPRGITTASEDDQKTYDLMSAGVTVSEIAKKLKVSDHVVRSRIKRVRQAKEDALLMKELRA